MKKEIEILDKETYYTVEYSVENIQGEEEVGIRSGKVITIHAIWINLIYQEEEEDIIVLYSDRKEKNHIIDLSEKSKIDVDYFKELVENKIK